MRPAAAAAIPVAIALLVGVAAGGEPGPGPRFSGMYVRGADTLFVIHLAGERYRMVLPGRWEAAGNLREGGFRGPARAMPAPGERRPRRAPSEVNARFANDTTLSVETRPPSRNARRAAVWARSPALPAIEACEGSVTGWEDGNGVRHGRVDEAWRPFLEPPVPAGGEAPPFPTVDGHPVSGRIVVHARVDDRGRVREAWDERHPPGGADSAVLERVRGWRFVPARVDGCPQTMWVEIPVTFGVH